MDKNAKLLKLAALMVLVSGAGYMLAHSGAATVDGPDGPAAAHGAGSGEPNYFAFVRSMDGTRPDGDLHQNAADKLVVDAELAHLFDYYLAGLGEKPLESIRFEISRELDRKLRPEPAAQARRLLDSYLQYKRALAGIDRAQQPQTQAATQPVPQTATPEAAQAATLAAAQARLAAMRQLRHDYFTEEEIAGLFGAADAYDDDAIARLRIAADTSLDAAQRKQQLAALDDRLPPTLRDDRDEPTKVLRLEEAVQQARAQGAGDNEIYRLRATTLSPAAADRLSQLDHDEVDWARRIAQYKLERQQIMDGNTVFDPAALQHLRDSIFTSDEQRRLGAYE
jgi:lipase chaperone LimK